jgi:hypothetical protein
VLSTALHCAFQRTAATTPSQLDIMLILPLTARHVLLPCLLAVLLSRTMSLISFTEPPIIVDYVCKKRTGLCSASVKDVLHLTMLVLDDQVPETVCLMPAGAVVLCST